MGTLPAALRLYATPMLAEVFLILSVAIGIHVSLTSPTPPPPKEQRRLNDFSIVNILFHIYKYSCWIHGIIEILILILPTISQEFPQSTVVQRVDNAFFGYFLPSSIRKETTIFFPPLRILGAFFILSASTIRYSCYRELGRHFTFHVAVLDDHSLITTGPYSIVRHPSYSGLALLNIGVILWHSTSGGWLRQSRFYTRPVTWIGIISTLLTMVALTSMTVTRPKEEDKMLKKEFGKKWDEWKTRVPYRLFPGVY